MKKYALLNSGLQQSRLSSKSQTLVFHIQRPRIINPPTRPRHQAMYKQFVVPMPTSMVYTLGPWIYHHWPGLAGKTANARYPLARKRLKRANENPKFKSWTARPRADT